MTVSAAEFKRKCMSLLAMVEKTGQEVIITKRGKPVAKLIAVLPARKPAFGHMKGTFEICGDIISPTGERWEADSNE